MSQGDLVGSFPLWLATSDGRRITTVLIKRQFPLLLFAERQDGPVRVGDFDAVTFVADRHMSVVVVHATFDDPAYLDRYAGWFLVPNLEAVRSVWAAGVTTMTGTLAAATLVEAHVWPRHWPIEAVP